MVMIPKIIHQIWIGDPAKKPVDYMNTWIKQHPSWDYIIWTEQEIDKLNLVNRDKYDYYYKLKKYHGCANIVRIEVLYKYGGIYVDADSVCNNPMDDLLDQDFFAVYSPNINLRVGNAFIGSAPKHKILKSYIDKISTLTKIEPPWDTVGGTCLKQVLENLNAMDKVLPSYCFYTEDKSGNSISCQGKNYSSHYWGSTHSRY